MAPESTSSSTAAAGDLRTCPKCGTDYPKTAKFCPECGRHAEEGDAERVAEGKKGFLGRRKSKRATKEEMTRLTGSSLALSTNDFAGFRLLYDDGVAETDEGVFCKTQKFSDISYENERHDVQQELFQKFCMVHAAFAPGTCYQLNLLNIPTRRRDIERYLPETGPNSDIARSFNEIIADRQRRGRIEFDRPNYITYAVTAEDDASAARKLSSLGEAVSTAFSRMDVNCKELDGLAKAELVKTMLCGPDEPMWLDYERLRKTAKEHVRDFVVPAWATYLPTEKMTRKTLVLPNRLVKSFLIKDFGNDLSDRALRSIRALPIPMNISLLFRPQPKGETVRAILQNIDITQAEMIDYARSVARSGGDPTLLPVALENREASQREQLDFITDHDQTVSFFQGIITVWAQTEEKMADYTDMIMSERGNWTIDIVELPMQQEEALVSALPLATPRLHDKYRSLATAEGATLIPFVSQNIHDDPKRSLMIGVDRSSGDSILIDTDKTKSPHLWLFGITGAGKSMQMNSMLSYSILQYPRTELDEKTGAMVNTDPACPQWHVFDFHKEYVELADRYGATISYFGPGHKSCINCMDMATKTSSFTIDDVRANTDAFLATFESTMGRTLTRAEQSIIDRCLQDVYEPYIGTSARPSLIELYDLLREMQIHTDEGYTTAKTAEDLANSLEIFVTGSMNSFSGQTNVEVNPQLNVYVMSELGSTMQTLAMMSAIQHVKKCVRENHRKGKPTYAVFEEVQILFDNDSAVRVLESLFAEERKYGLHVICVTQLPNRVLSHPRAVNLFENSSTFVLMPQQAENADTMSEMFRLSATQANALSLSADVGTGLVIVDGVKIAFRNFIPNNTLCYEFWNTDPDKYAKAQKAKQEENSAPESPVEAEPTRDDEKEDGE